MNKDNCCIDALRSAINTAITSSRVVPHSMQYNTTALLSAMSSQLSSAFETTDVSCLLIIVNMRMKRDSAQAGAMVATTLCSNILVIIEY